MSELSYHQPNSHSNKIMLRLILNRLEAKEEERLAEERAGLRPGWSTVEQIFKTPVIVEKQLQYRAICSTDL